MGLEWDKAGAAHRWLLARLPRCKRCLVTVPAPTRDGFCLYCLRRGEPLGSVVAPIRQPTDDPVAVQEG